jgi:hypothetical protein
MKAIYSSDWGSIVGILKKIEKLMSSYKIKLVYIDGKKVASLADDLFRYKKKKSNEN